MKTSGCIFLIDTRNFWPSAELSGIVCAFQNQKPTTVEGMMTRTFDDHLAQGISLLEAGETGKAAAEFRRCMELEPENPEGYFNLGEALAGDEHLDDAVKVYLKGLKIEPHDAAAHFNLGELYYDLGESDEAEKECLEAIRLDPAFTLSYLTLGSLYMDREHVADAIKYLELYLKMEKSPQAAEMVAEVKAVVEGLKEDVGNAKPGQS